MSRFSSFLGGSLYRAPDTAPTPGIQSRIASPSVPSPVSVGTTYSQNTTGALGANYMPSDPIQAAADGETNQILQFQLAQNGGKSNHPQGIEGQLKQIRRHQYMLRQPESGAAQKFRDNREQFSRYSGGQSRFLQQIVDERTQRARDYGLPSGVSLGLGPHHRAAFDAQTEIWRQRLAESQKTPEQKHFERLSNAGYPVEQYR